MVSSQEELPGWLKDLNEQLGTYEFHEDEERQQQYLDTTRALGETKTLDELALVLKHCDPELRLIAVEALFYLGFDRGIDLITPLFYDENSKIRWFTCHMLRRFGGGDRVIADLLHLLQNDPNPQVRGEAAGALGTTSAIDVLPALLLAERNDHEVDMHGHSPASVSKTSTSKILLWLLLRHLKTHTESDIRLQLSDELLLIGTIRLLFNKEMDTPLIGPSIESQATYNSWGRWPDWLPYKNLPWHAYGPSIHGIPVSTTHKPPFEVVIQLFYGDEYIERTYIFGYQEDSWTIMTLFHRNSEVRD